MSARSTERFLPGDTLHVFHLAVSEKPAHFRRFSRIQEGFTTDTPQWLGKEVSLWIFDCF